jgi:hypothetical protein
VSPWAWAVHAGWAVRPRGGCLTRRSCHAPLDLGPEGRACPGEAMPCWEDSGLHTQCAGNGRAWNLTLCVRFSGGTQARTAIYISPRRRPPAPACPLPLDLCAPCPCRHRFMAPEALSSEVWPASDIWAAGVMAYQLLSGECLQFIGSGPDPGCRLGWAAPGGRAEAAPKAAAAPWPLGTSQRGMPWSRGVASDRQTDPDRPTGGLVCLLTVILIARP